jgi:hypothetical protein
MERVNYDYRDIIASASNFGSEPFELELCKSGYLYSLGRNTSGSSVTYYSVYKTIEEAYIGLVISLIGRTDVDYYCIIKNERHAEFKSTFVQVSHKNRLSCTLTIYEEEEKLLALFDGIFNAVIKNEELTIYTGESIINVGI